MNEACVAFFVFFKRKPKGAPNSNGTHCVLVHPGHLILCTVDSCRHFWSEVVLPTQFCPKNTDYMSLMHLLLVGAQQLFYGSMNSFFGRHTKSCFHFHVLMVLIRELALHLERFLFSSIEYLYSRVPFSFSQANLNIGPNAVAAVWHERNTILYSLYGKRPYLSSVDQYLCLCS